MPKNKTVFQSRSFEFFVFNTYLTFLYKSDIDRFKKFQKKSFLQWDFELTTATIT